MINPNFMSDFEKKIRSLQRKKKRNLIIKIVSACLTLVLIVVYFLLPVSQVYNSRVSGNIHYTQEEILSIAGIKNKDSLYLISKDKIINNLKASPLIEDNSVKVSITPLGLNIELEEVVPVIYYNENKYLSNGKILDEDLLKSKDPLIGDYLYLHTQNLIPTFSKPYDDKFIESRLSHLSKLILSLSQESKDLIYGVSYDSNNYYYNFYYQTGLEDGTILKIVFDSAKKIEDLNVIVEKEKVERYISYLSNSKTKDNFVSFEETLNGEIKNVKSIKIVMQTIQDEVYYHVKYNNPTGSGVVDGEENSNV